MSQRWPIVPLGDLVEVHDRYRVPVSRREREKRPGATPYYGASGVIDSIDGYTHDGRFLLIAEDGENLRSRKTPVAFIAEGKFWANNHVHVLKVRSDRANDVFLCGFIENSNISGWVTGAAQPKLSQANLVQIPIAVPPVRVQNRVAAVLAAYDELIENNLRRIEILEETAQAVYREWFVNFRFPGHQDVPFVDSPLGPIPDGWAVRRSLELCEQGVLEIGDGYRAKNAEMVPDGKYAFLRVKNVRQGYLDLEDVDRLPSSYGPKLGAKVARPGDTVVSMKGSVGRTAWIDSRTPPIVYSPQVSYWRSLDHSRLPPEFVRLWVLSDSFIQQCASAKGSTAMADYVNLADQRSMLLIIPSLPVLDAFVSIASPLLRLAQTLRAQQEILRTTRDLLLPKLVSGEIDVSELDIETEWLAS